MRTISAFGLVLVFACGQSVSGHRRFPLADATALDTSDGGDPFGGSGAPVDTSSQSSSSSSSDLAPTSCTAFACPGSAGCSSELGPAASNGEDARIGYDINPGTGNLFLAYDDIAAKPALGPALGFSRYYNSQSFNTTTALGPGWSHTFSWQILQNGTQAEMLTPWGKIIYFNASGSSWTSPAGEFGTLTGSFAAGFTYTDRNGTTFAMDKLANQGRLLSITPPNDTAITVSYSSGLKISTVTSGDLSLTFGYTGSNITSIQDPANNTWSYGYTSGILTSVTLPNTDSGGHHGQLTYTYSSVTVAGQLFSAGTQVAQLTEVQVVQTNGTSIPVGLFSYANPTSGSSQVAIAASGAAGTTLQREVSLSYSLCTSGTSTTTVTLNGGSKTVTSTQISGLQRLTGLSATAGSGAAGEWTQESRSWNTSLTLAAITDGLSNQTLFQSYDSRGNPAAVVEASGSTVQRTTGYTYHPVMSAPLTITRSSVDGVTGHNHVTTYDYDNDYNSNYNQAPTNYLAQIVESGYTDTTLSGSLGMQTTSVTQIHYDSNHRATSATGPLSSQSTTLTYWPSSTSGAAKNRLETTTVTTSSTASLTTTFSSYDSDGRLLQVSDPNSVSTTVVYQPTGEVTQSTLSDGTHSLQDTMSYNLARQVTQHTTPESTSYNYEYDAAGRMWRAHGVAAGSTTPWSQVLDFDSWGRVVTDRRFGSLGSDEGMGCAVGGSEQFCKDIRYNAYGRRSLFLSPETGGMDCSGSKCQVSYVYDNDNVLQSVTEVGLYTTTYGRDALERVNKITLPTSKYSTLTYDLNDHMASRRDPKDSHNGGSGGNSRLTTYLYDDYGRMVSMTSPDNGAWLYNFDLASNRVSAKDPAGQQTTYSYDLANRRTGVTETGAANDGLAWVYDETGTIGGYSYTNTKGRLTSMQARDPSGNRIFSHNSYDFAGRVITQVEERGTNASPTYKALQYTWGNDSEPTLITYPDGLQVTPKYPATGGYGPIPLPNEIDVTYNGGNSVVAQQLAYFPDSALSSLTFGDGTTRTITRNLRGEISHVTSGHNGSANVLDETINFDAAGTGRVNSVNWFPGQTNTWTWNMGYDSLFRLTSYSTNVRPGSDSYTWNYDEVGNRTSQSYTNSSGTVSTSYSFDSTNNTSQTLTTTITAGTGSNTAYGYDADGQRSKFNPSASNFTTYPYYTYSYNTRRQLIGLNQQVNSTTLTGLKKYYYDAHGRRWQTTDVSSSNVIQNYYDTLGRMLEEYATAPNVNGCGAWTVTDHIYLADRFDEIGRVIRSYQSTSGCSSYSYVDKDLQYVHEDHRGAIFAIVGSAAGLELENEIDPWGRVVCSDLPGTDKKPCTSDDVAGTTTDDFDGHDGQYDSVSLLRHKNGTPPYVYDGSSDGNGDHSDPAIGSRTAPAHYNSLDGYSTYVNRHYDGILAYSWEVGGGGPWGSYNPAIGYYNAGGNGNGTTNSFSGVLGDASVTQGSWTWGGPGGGGSQGLQGYGGPQWAVGQGTFTGNGDGCEEAGQRAVEAATAFVAACIAFVEAPSAGTYAAVIATATIWSSADSSFNDACNPSGDDDDPGVAGGGPGEGDNQSGSPNIGKGPTFSQVVLGRAKMPTVLAGWAGVNPSLGGFGGDGNGGDDWGSVGRGAAGGGMGDASDCGQAGNHPHYWGSGGIRDYSKYKDPIR
jgi:YD repeat-containing protein